MPDKSDLRVERFVLAHSLKVHSPPQLGRQGGQSMWQLITHFIGSQEAEGYELCTQLEIFCIQSRSPSQGIVLLIFTQIFLLLTLSRDVFPWQL